VANAASTFRFGQTISIGPGSGIPAGTYTIMPPRYALLAGAFAVQPVSGYQDIVPGRAISETGGTVIVAGKIGSSQADTLASRWSGFRVLTDAQFRQHAGFTDYLGSDFFAASAAARDVAAPRLARDAGALAVAGDRVRFGAQIDGAAGNGGRGAELSFAAPQ